MANPTVSVRIIVHLMDYRRSSEEYVFPREMTQLGMAQVLGIGRAHVGNELRKLEREGRVEVKSAYVATENRKLNVYTLTTAGRSMGKRLVEILEDQPPSRPEGAGWPQIPRTGEDTVQKPSGDLYIPLHAPPDSPSTRD